MMAKAVTTLQWTGLVVLFGGDYIFPYLGMPEPQLYGWLKERKMFAALTIFLLGNNIANGLLSTGAFESAYPIFSMNNI